MHALEFKPDHDVDFQDEWEPWTPLLEGVTATGQLLGHLLEMRLAQRFHNPRTKPVELRYTFPLPARAVLLSLEATVNGQTRRSRIVRRNEARTTYAEAVSEGDTAVMLEDLNDGRFELALGNLLPGERAVVMLHYAEPLQTEQGNVRLMLATTLAPRYGHAFATATPLPDARAQHALALSLFVDGALARARIGSPTHAIRLRAADEGVHLELARSEAMDRDLVLCFDDVPAGDGVTAAPDPRDAHVATVMATFTPDLPATADEADAEPVTVKLLVDCSGSMKGPSIASARTAVMTVLDALGSEDRLTVSRFGFEVQHRQQAPWRATTRALADARSWAARLEADMGGTELAGALASTMALPTRGAADVLLLTDGQIGLIEGVVAQAQRGAQRVFIVGIGHAPCESNLRRLAAATGGACVFVAPGEAVVQAMQQMLARMRKPRIGALALEWPAGVSPVNLCALPRAAFAGDSVIAYAQIPVEQLAALADGVRLTGTVQDQTLALGHAMRPTGATAIDTDTLARLAARSRVSEMNDPQATDTALQYQLLTEGTACLLQFDRPESERPSGMPVSVAVAPMPTSGMNFCLAAMPNAMRWRPQIECSRMHDPDEFKAPRGDDLELQPAFAAWLKALAPDEWPCTYDDLVRGGLPRKDASWLRREIGRHNSEADMVHAFVALVLGSAAPQASAETLKLARHIELLWSVRDIMERLNVVRQRRRTRSIK